jgi:GAF domain-containing protein
MSMDLPSIPSDRPPANDPAAEPALVGLAGKQMPWHAQAAADDDDLRESLAALSQLATAQMEFTDVLSRVAEYAVLAIPRADGVGLTLAEARHAQTIVASAPFVAEVEAVQLGIDEGPCITAMAEGRAVRSGSLATDAQWPQFGPAVGDLGVRSALAVPLLNAGDVLGAMNVYSHQSDAFDERAVVMGELFAVPAAIAVHNAQVLAHAQRVAARLETALTQRAVIDQAIGILIGRVGCTADQASDALRQMTRGRPSRFAAADRFRQIRAGAGRRENTVGPAQVPRRVPQPRMSRDGRFRPSSDAQVCRWCRRIVRPDQ